jgi:hypothetical protein
LRFGIQRGAAAKEIDARKCSEQKAHTTIPQQLLHQNGPSPTYFLTATWLHFHHAKWHRRIGLAITVTPWYAPVVAAMGQQPHDTAAACGFPREFLLFWRQPGPIAHGAAP